MSYGRIKLSLGSARSMMALSHHKYDANTTYMEDELSLDENTETFYFEPFGDFFERTKAEVILAEYYFNRNYILKGYVTVNEFLDFLNLAHIPDGDKKGWSLEAGEIIYGYKWIDFVHPVIRSDDIWCICIEMPFEPTEDFLNPFGPEDE